VWGARRDVTENRVIRTILGIQMVFVCTVAVTNAHLALVFSELPLPGLLGDFFLEIPLALIFSAIMFALWRKFRNLPPVADTTPRECWRAGWFYVNREDPAWTVRVGIGFVPNFAHRWIGVTQVILGILLLGSLWYTFA